MEKTMRKQRFLTFFLLICLLLPLASCTGRKNKYTVQSFDYFDTVAAITGYEKNKKSFDKVSGEIFALLGEYHKLFDIYNSYDGIKNLCDVNSLVGGVHPVLTVDERIIDMLLYAKDMHKYTDGKMNIAMGSVLSVWHRYRTEGTASPESASLPPMGKLTEAAKHTEINNLIIDTEKNTVWLSDPEMTLDVGAIAKGYAVEKVAEKLTENGITGYVINVGGNVRAVGCKPDGEKWSVGIENPDVLSSKAYVAMLSLSDKAVVTSGAYQRFYTVGGKKYHHIIDPETLMPAERYLSVSVVCKDSGAADALSTALFCMPYEKGIALVEGMSDTEAIWVMTDGSERTSSGFYNCIEHN